MVHGFVEELVVNEDPEYQWIDRIRTPRASNEARQRLISLMSGEEIYGFSLFMSFLFLINLCITLLFRRAAEENWAEGT